MSNQDKYIIKLLEQGKQAGIKQERERIIEIIMKSEWIHPKCRNKVKQEIVLKKDKEYNRMYYLKNREKILAICREYYKENKDRLLMKVKKYSQENRDKIRNYRKKYYQENKEEFKEKIRNQKKKTNYASEKTIKQRLIRRVKSLTRKKYPLSNGIKCEFCSSMATEHHHNTYPIHKDKFNYICHNCHIKLNSQKGDNSPTKFGQRRFIS